MLKSVLTVLVLSIASLIAFTGNNDVVAVESDELATVYGAAACNYTGCKTSKYWVMTDVYGVVFTAVSYSPPIVGSVPDGWLGHNDSSAGGTRELHISHDEGHSITKSYWLDDWTPVCFPGAGGPGPNIYRYFLVIRNTDGDDLESSITIDHTYCACP